VARIKAAQKKGGIYLIRNNKPDHFTNTNVFTLDALASISMNYCLKKKTDLFSPKENKSRKKKYDPSLECMQLFYNRADAGEGL